MKKYQTSTLTSKSTARKSKQLRQNAKTWQNWQRTVRYFYLRFIRLQGSPEYIARGVAIGVFAGMFPILGLQMIVSVALAAIMGGHKIVAAAASWISNPFTYIPMYGFNFWIGQCILGRNTLIFSMEKFQSWQKLMELGTEVLTTLFLGCLIVGVIATIISYFVSLKMIRRIRLQRQLRRFT